MLNMRESWTDERLNDFASHVDRRFDQVDQRFNGVDQRFKEVDRRFDEANKRFDRVEGELHRVNDQLDGMHRSMLQIGGGVIIALIGLIATQL